MLFDLVQLFLLCSLRVRHKRPTPAVSTFTQFILNSPRGFKLRQKLIHHGDKAKVKIMSSLKGYVSCLCVQSFDSEKKMSFSKLIVTISGIVK